MGINKLNDAFIAEVSEWLDKQGEEEINKVSEKETDTDKYIKSMSEVTSERLKTPYSLL